MNLTAVKQLTELFTASPLSSLSYEDSEFKLSLAKGELAVTSAPTVRTDTVAASSDESFVTVASPVVGTVYRAREPGAAPLVAVGDRVSAGDALCVIEAMKIFSEVPAPCSGTVAEIAFTDGQLAEFGAKLVVLERGE